MQNANDSNHRPQNLRGLSVAEYMTAEPRLSLEQKTVLATHLAANVGQGSAADVENDEAILRMMIWSDEKSVIESVAHAAAGNPDTSRDLAWALANDDENVATPILAAAVALSEADLIAIVETSDSVVKMGAIAGRSSVSENLSRSLATHGDENVSRILLNNAQADIPADAIAAMTERHGQHDFIQERIAAREAAPDASAPAASPLERALMCHKAARIGYVNEINSEMLSELIFQLLEDDALTPEVLVRSLCLGNFDFFCRAFSFMAAQSKDDIAEAIIASPAAQIAKLWRKTSFTDEWLPAVSATATALTQLKVNYVQTDVGVFRKKVLERTISILDTAGTDIPASQRDFLRRHTD